MIDLSRLKSEVIKHLLLNLEKVESDTGYSNISLNCPNLDLINLLSYVDGTPIGYFKSRNGNSEILGIGYVAKFFENEKKEVEKLIFSNSSLRFFTCMRFNDDQKPAPEWKSFASFAFVLPMVSWIKENNNCFIEINFSNSIRKNLEERAEFIMALEGFLNLSSGFNPLKETFVFEDHLDTPSRDSWNTTIEKCLNHLAESSLDKVVLARKRILNLSTFNAVTYFQKLSSQSENCFLFFFKLNDGQAFFSITPELLFHKVARNIKLDSLAGTRNRGQSPQEDQLLERELKSSKKDLTEHRIVSREIHDLLVGICESISTPLMEGILKQRHVQHLHTIFNGILNEDLGIFEVIEKIHPTPAVNGFPRGPAKELIKQLEGFDRGLYAAPIGIISQESCELAVGIRSALLYDNQLHVFGGAGIITGSTAQKEWDETFNKMKNFLE
jgi:menaquinone-specific isochorismate synthase